MKTLRHFLIGFAALGGALLCFGFLVWVLIEHTIWFGYVTGGYFVLVALFGFIEACVSLGEVLYEWYSGAGLVE